MSQLVGTVTAEKQLLHKYLEAKHITEVPELLSTSKEEHTSCSGRVVLALGHVNVICTRHCTF